jgi:hypothetical protein
MPRKPDPLNASIQLQIKKGCNASLQKQQAVLRRWAETGYLPAGYRVTGVVWTNPGRKGPTAKYADGAAPRDAGSAPEVEEARLTLGRFLRNRRFAPKGPPEAGGSPRRRPHRGGD